MVEAFEQHGGRTFLCADNRTVRGAPACSCRGATRGAEHGGRGRGSVLAGRPRWEASRNGHSAGGDRPR